MQNTAEKRKAELAEKLKDQVGYKHAPQSVKDMTERDIAAGKQ